MRNERKIRTDPLSAQGQCGRLRVGIWPDGIRKLVDNVTIDATQRHIAHSDISVSYGNQRH